MTWHAYLVTHGEAPVVSRGPPDVSDERDVGKVDQVQPAIQDEPAGRPVVGDEVFIALTGKGPAVDEEEGEDDDDGSEDAPPQLLVHCGLDRLLSLDEIPQREVQAVECPDVEGGECGCEGEDD